MNSSVLIFKSVSLDRVRFIQISCLSPFELRFRTASCCLNPLSLFCIIEILNKKDFMHHATGKYCSGCCRVRQNLLFYTYAPISPGASICSNLPSVQCYALDDMRSCTFLSFQKLEYLMDRLECTPKCHQVRKWTLCFACSDEFTQFINGI